MIALSIVEIEFFLLFGEFIALKHPQQEGDLQICVLTSSQSSRTSPQNPPVFSLSKARLKHAPHPNR